MPCDWGEFGRLPGTQNPKLMNVHFRILSLSCLILLLGSITACNSDSNPTDEITAPEGYTLLWSDEFDGTEINSSNWVYETGDGTAYGLPVGWGNNEKQQYTSDSENSGIVTDEGTSVLAITAREAASGYTSAKLTTQELVSVRFGRIDIRAKLPQGQGIWPAFWLLGENRAEINWPGCGEIDVIEMLGHEPNKMYSTVHYTNADNEHDEDQGTYTLPSGTFSDAYYVFTLDWTPESITYLLDGIQVHETVITEDMKEFLRPAYLILNIAVGGYWPGEPDETTTFPQTMYVDYVRVFTKDGLELPAAPVLDVAEETVGEIIEPTLADEAILTSFSALGNLEVLAWGGGGEPEISASETAIDGELSLSYHFPGGAWGGAYLQMETPADLSDYQVLRFSLNMPATLVNAEIKLESSATNAVVFLEDYAGTPVEEGFVEYEIPLADFVGLDLTKVHIPFSIWNPLNATGGFAEATVLIDGLHFAE